MTAPISIPSNSVHVRIRDLESRAGGAMKCGSWGPDETESFMTQPRYRSRSEASSSSLNERRLSILSEEEIESDDHVVKKNTWSFLGGLFKSDKSVTIASRTVTRRDSSPVQNYQPLSPLRGPQPMSPKQNERLAASEPSTSPLQNRVTILPTIKEVAPSGGVSFGPRRIHSDVTQNRAVPHG